MVSFLVAPGFSLTTSARKKFRNPDHLGMHEVGREGANALFLQGTP
jgi:hypothetical protein